MAWGNPSVNFALLLATCCVITITLNLLHDSVVDGGVQSISKKSADAFKEKHLSVPDPQTLRMNSEGRHTKTSASRIEAPIAQTSDHTLAGLSCAHYGGPSDEIAHEMVYWSDIPSDAKYVSPFKKAKGGEVRYMTFEPDGGGWNNIRMAMETVVSMAHATGRTLVMPPEQGMYLLRKDRSKQRTAFSFADFFHFDSLAREHEGVDIITMEEFLKREAMTGRLVNKTSGIVSFPPNNRTDWNNQDVKDLKEWLRQVTHVPLWRPGKCLAAFPASTGPNDIAALHSMKEQIVKEGFPKPDQYVDKPVAVDAPAIDRMREVINRRDELCVYDEEMQKAHVIHFMCYHKMRVRLLVHFYAFLFFEDWKQENWNKRFIRDHVRYIDELQCAAARVVHAIRERARQKNPAGNPDGLFDSFHIRRGDFQFKRSRVEADVIYENSKSHLTEGATVFIATDERKKDFFKPLADHYDICFLDDFKHLLQGLNTNYYGMIDQLVASKSRVFFGCFWSTFTGYINRMRGYYVAKHKLKGHEDGTMQSFYYIPSDKKFEMQKYVPVRPAYFAREFPTSWRDIDKGIKEMSDVMDLVDEHIQEDEEKES